MNIIDKKFNELIAKFNKMSEKEIFINIKNSFLSIPTENPHIAHPNIHM